MKKYLFLSCFFFVSFVSFSQKGISYQAVIIDPERIDLPAQDIVGQPLFKADVWVRFSIYTGSSLQFEEVHKTTTDEYGLVNLLIGSVSSASFNSLNWDARQKKLSVHVSFNQGVSYSLISDQTLTYNPYAFYADSAGAATIAEKLKTTLGITGGGTGATTAVGARANLGLSNIDNTSDTDKPISMATKAALDSIAMAINKVTSSTGSITQNIPNASFIGRNTVGSGSPEVLTAATAKSILALTKTDVGLENVDNTPDLLKPISTATQIALDLKATTAYVDTSTTPDATTSVKGKLQLAGDLAGTADSPIIADFAITTLKIADNAVTTSKIPDQTISAAKIATNAVTIAKLPSGATPTTFLRGDGTWALPTTNTASTSILLNGLSFERAAFSGDVTAAQNTNILTISNAAITTSKIADDAITSVKIADGAIATQKITDGAVTLTKQANIATASLLGRNTAGSGSPEVLTAGAAKALLALTKTDVGLENIDNTSDLLKPISTATQTALDLKATIASPAFTGTPTAVTAALGTNSTQIATTEYVDAANRTIFSTRVSLSSAATPAPIGSSLFNYYTLTALAEGATFNAPSGTPLDGNSLVLKIKASGAEIALAWNTIYRGGTDIALPTITNKTMVLHFMYNAADARWDMVGITNGI